MVTDVPHVNPARVRGPQPLHLRHPRAPPPDADLQSARRGGDGVRLEPDGDGARERVLGPHGAAVAHRRGRAAGGLPHEAHAARHGGALHGGRALRAVGLGRRQCARVEGARGGEARRRHCARARGDRVSREPQAEVEDGQGGRQGAEVRVLLVCCVCEVGDWVWDVDGRCCRSRHIPKPVYKASQLKRTMLEARRVKEERRRKHTRAGETKPQAERKTVGIAEQP